MTIASSKYQILVTGRTGSLGSQMPDFVVPLNSRLESSLDEKINELRTKLVKPSVLIHMAALTSVPECQANPEKAKRLNVQASLEWYQAAKQVGVDRFIFVSTSHVFQSPEEKKPLTLNSPLGPKALYGQLKLEAENELKSEADSLKTKISIARVFSLLSKNIRPGFLQHSLIERAKKKDYSALPGFDNVRDFVDADFVCQELVRLANSAEFPPLVLIASGKGKTVGELAQEIYEQYGADPKQLVGLPGRPGDAAYLVGTPTLFK